MRRREQHHYVSGQSVLNAVALQDHFTRSLSFGEIRYRQRVQQQQHQQQYLYELSLAQQFGLVKRPRDTLSEEEWRFAQEQAMARKDALHGCPICHENFCFGEQLLLSCSHIFHKQCLKRFEKFSRQRCCPVCRTEHYQTMDLKIPSRLYKNFFATRIQSAYRAYKCRKDYADYKWRHPPEDPGKRKEWFAKKLESASNRLLDQMAVDENNVNLLLANIDNTLATSKQIYDVFGSKDYNAIVNDELTPGDGSDLDWHLVIERAIERCDSDCSICIMALQKEGGGDLSLLSCSHLFHSHCISEFEGFHASEQLLCPICRTLYRRLDL